MFTTSTLAVFGLAAICSAHVHMNTPVTYANSMDNAPLDASGSNYPCQQASGALTKQGASTSMALGSTQPLSFTGSAVHGGGSCQISITYDTAPTKDGVFKVIHSIIGGCPMANINGNNGNDPNQVSPTKYSFQIPDNIPTGEATLAWSWVNRIGNREFYMNCAPVTITGSPSKRDEGLETRNATQLAERDTTALDALPDMFVANIPIIDGSCDTIEGQDTQYPNPGPSVEYMGQPANRAAANPQCHAAAGGSSPSPSAAPASSAIVAPSAAPSIPGGVFVTAGAASPTTLATSATAAPTVPSSVASVEPTPVAPAAPVGTGLKVSDGALTGACTTEGSWNCMGSNSFQRCASGTWSVVQQLAGGTKCTTGQSAVIDMVATKKRRAVRFSNEHVRRNIRNTS